ncbi:tRNA (adenosine(37)-N6)-dimethylallyltransferase MiaA [Jannaschia sp. 2305UL9-9]|uniref:tRNA (adenosine(37)-N6)-dimethylallyltransferase MiaA n=1 Tax=Jannaschia sp. 2305UL9-9 TaxID=3121638 RepID=UPI0035270913
MLEPIRNIPADQPVLIAGPTASGKSALALAIAEVGGGRIINADALQVFANWSVLTARPPEDDLRRAPHSLYGHVARTDSYSVGAWLRDVAPLLTEGPRPIIVGGTALYFRALTEGLADIPPIPPAIRAESVERLEAIGLPAMVAELEAEVAQTIDTANPMRVLRAWEVSRATGRSIRAWQAETPPPLLPLSSCAHFLIDAPKDWLTPRIERRFDMMLAAGALEEAQANLADWQPGLNSSQAIGAPELIAHLKGELTLSAARERAIIATRRYAKRQRTAFKARMKTWRPVNAADL